MLLEGENVELAVTVTFISGVKNLMPFPSLQHIERFTVQLLRCSWR